MQTLPQELRDTVNSYCQNHVESRSFIENKFGFVKEVKLLEEIVTAYAGARYVYKLGQALRSTGQELQAKSKFEITRYASIYEASISYLLESNYAAHPSVVAISQSVQYAPMSQRIKIFGADGIELHTCRKKLIKKNKTAIPFNDKVDCCVAIGFLHYSLSADIKRFYRLRNGMHLLNAVKHSIQCDLDQSRLSYRRLRPFTMGINGFIANGKLPSNAMTEAALKQLQSERALARKARKKP